MKEKPVDRENSANNYKVVWLDKMAPGKPRKKWIEKGEIQYKLQQTPHIPAPLSSITVASPRSNLQLEIRH